MTCGTPLHASAIPQYPLAQFASKAPPRSVTALEQWLAANSPHGNWTGKLYVARSISWNGSAFLQHGCSPNYHAGWWTLTCCKHEMRSASPINHALSDPAGIAVFIFTLTEQDSTGSQNLVSVAKVTAHFSAMSAYARHLIRSGDPALISSRLSRNRRNDGLFGWRFGDCHSDRRGKIGAPHVDHEHGLNRDHSWDADNATGHTLLMSNRFLVWSRPAFSSTHTLKQSRYGYNIDAGSLRRLLK